MYVLFSYQSLPCFVNIALSNYEATHTIYLTMSPVTPVYKAVCIISLEGLYKSYIYKNGTDQISVRL